ncbi:molybdenum cofactor biosynthesis protein B [Aliidiomarina sp. Khilg15.8]
MSKQTEFEPLRVAILTVSDKHQADTDTTGDWLMNAAEQAGHQVAERAIATNNLYQLRALASAWIADERVQAIIVNGGTGFAAHNCTETALIPLLDKKVDGFGELFRQLSYQSIGTASMQSQAFAGLANNTILFAVPGSGGAAKLAWNELIASQLDARQGPCNFVPHLRKRVCNG